MDSQKESPSKTQRVIRKNMKPWISHFLLLESGKEVAVSRPFKWHPYKDLDFLAREEK